MSDMQAGSRRKRSIWVILLIIIALAATGAAGVAWWILYHKSSSAEQQVAPPPPAPVFMPLDTFTVNLVNADNNPDRVLYVGFTLRLSDEETRTRLTNYLPEVRSRLLLLLSRQDAISLANEQGKQKLIEQIKQVLSPHLSPDSRIRSLLTCYSLPLFCGNPYGR